MAKHLFIGVDPSIIQTVKDSEKLPSTYGSIAGVTIDEGLKFMYRLRARNQTATDLYELLLKEVENHLEQGYEVVIALEQINPPSLGPMRNPRIDVKRYSKSVFSQGKLYGGYMVLSFMLELLEDAFNVTTLQVVPTKWQNTLGLAQKDITLNEKYSKLVTVKKETLKSVKTKYRKEVLIPNYINERYNFNEIKVNNPMYDSLALAHYARLKTLGKKDKAKF